MTREWMAGPRRATTPGIKLGHRRPPLPWRSPACEYRGPTFERLLLEVTLRFADRTNRSGHSLRKLRPEGYVYLLIHVVLFTGGLLIAQAGGATWVAVGTSVAATGICGWVIFFWIRMTEKNVRGTHRIQQLGITDAFPARSVPIRPEYEMRFELARQQIDFLGFGLRALREDFGGQMQNWLNRVPLRILLIDPEQPHSDWNYVTQRDAEEGNSRGSIRSDVASFLEFMTPLKNRFPDRLNIRLYSCLPSINICRIDDEAFWGPYLLGAQSRNTPTLLVARYGAMFDVLVSHYDLMWSDERYSRDAYVRVGATYQPANIT